VVGSNIHVVWRESIIGGSEILYKQSTDGGATWSSSQNLSGTTGISHNPFIAVVGSNIHVVWSDNITGNYEIFYKQSTDGGATWSSSQNLSGTTGVSYGPSIAVDGCNFHVVWWDNITGNDEIFYKQSTDGGATWSSSQNLSETPEPSRVPFVAVFGCNAHVVWGENPTGDSKILYKQGSD
jgi:hypothetical protein